MSGSLSDDEMKKRHVDSMGEELGPFFHALWKDVRSIHTKWSQYVELFGTKPSRVALLNEAAGVFFGDVQELLFDDVLLHISRLTDKPKSCGKPCLTVKRLADLIADAGLKDTITTLVTDSEDKAKFSRDWRNRRIAHTDLDLALEGNVAPLEPATRQKVSTALNAIARVLNAVDGHYSDSETNFNGLPSPRGPLALLCVLDAGLQAEKERQARINDGKYRPEDLQSRDL